MAASTLSLLSSSTSSSAVSGGSGESGRGSLAAFSSASSPPDIVEDFFELSARVLSRLASFAFQPDQRQLQARLVSCACQCLLMAHREALSATCHFLSTLLSEASDATPARNKRGGRPMAPQHSQAVQQLLLDGQLAAQLAASFAYDIAVHLPQQSVHVLAEPLLLLYYCVPQHFAALLAHALQPYTVPPQPPLEQSAAAPSPPAPLDATAIARFTSQLSQLAESATHIPVSRAKAVSRSAKDLLDAFAYACRQQAHR